MSVPSKDERPTARQIYTGALYAVLVLAAATAFFYLLPVGWLGLHRTSIAVGTFLIGMAGAGSLVIWQVRVYRQGVATGAARLRGLLVALYLTVIFFALAYFVLATADPSQIAELNTRTDALYFSFTTISTVGFGDVHAVGQEARLMVTLQMAFDLLFVSLAIAAARSAGMPPALVRRTDR